MATKKPDEMTWDERVQDLYGQITNRPQFSYDPNSDPLYQSAKNQFVQNGRRAMEDTMGQAAGLTGGYNSSYAQNVGQQSYNDYMLKLNDEMRNYAQMAKANYDADTDRLYSQLNLAQGMADTEYARSRDAIADQRYQQEWEADQAYRDWQKSQAEASAASDQAYRDWQMRNSDQSNAYNWAMQLLATGQMPSEATLAAAGIDPTEAQNYAKYYANQIALQNYAGSGGSGSRGSGSGSWSAGGGYPDSGSVENGDGNVDNGNKNPTTPISSEAYKGVRDSLYNLAMTWKNGDQGAYDKAVEIMNSIMDGASGTLTPKQQKDLTDWFQYLFLVEQKPEQSNNSGARYGGGGKNLDVPY